MLSQLRNGHKVVFSGSREALKLIRNLNCSTNHRAILTRHVSPRNLLELKPRRGMSQDAESFFDPPYLADLKPKVGFYDLLNLKIKAYDYVVLEKYQSYLHKTIRNMQIQVTKTWSVPYQELQFESMAHGSTAIVASERVLIYERTIQMKQVLVTKLPLLIDIVNMTLPAGVSFNVAKHTPQEEDRIYFKDAVLEQYKEELQEMKDTPLIGL